MDNIKLMQVGRALLVAAVLAAAPAAADPPHARAAAEAAARTFGDWRLACGPAACAIRSDLRSGDGSAILSLAASGVEGSGALALRTPMPLLLPEGLALGLGDAPARLLDWRTCNATGCVAEAPLDPDLLAGLKRERSAEVTLTLVDGVRVRLPASLVGFTAAWRALGAAPRPVADGVSPP